MARKKTTPEDELPETSGQETQETQESQQAVEDMPQELPDDSGETQTEETPVPEDTPPQECPSEKSTQDSAALELPVTEPTFTIPDVSLEDGEPFPEEGVLSADPDPVQDESPTAEYILADSAAAPPNAESEPEEPPVIPYGEEPEESAPSSDPSAPQEPAPLTPGEERRAFYQTDFHGLDRGLSPEQQQEWNSIYASYRGRSILSGTVVGVDLHAVYVRDKDTGERVRQEMYCAIVIPYRVRILIPETEMWAAGEVRPGFVMRNIVGAKLDMVILHVDREGGFAIGSRRMALRSRRYYFTNRPNLNHPGARVKCSFLAVGPRRSLVTCHGYDMNLTQREIRYTAIPDLRDVYHPGDELDCIVKEFDPEHNHLLVSIKETESNPFEGAELRHPIGSRRQAVIAGKYAGGVFCNLPDGAVCMCSYSSHYEDGEFAVGDTVILVIQRFVMEKKQIYGKIVAKW